VSTAADVAYGRVSASPLPDGWSARHRAMLRAVAAGRAELTCSRCPDLFVDGRCCTDHAASALLVALGLVAAASSGCPGARVPARVTASGRAVLNDLASAAPTNRGTGTDE